MEWALFLCSINHKGSHPLMDECSFFFLSDDLPNLIYMKKRMCPIAHFFFTEYLKIIENRMDTRFTRCKFRLQRGIMICSAYCACPA